MKKFLMLSALVVGLAFVAAPQSAQAAHGRSYGYGGYGGYYCDSGYGGYGGGYYGSSIGYASPRVSFFVGRSYPRYSYRSYVGHRHHGHHGRRHHSRRHHGHHGHH